MPKKTTNQRSYNLPKWFWYVVTICIVAVIAIVGWLLLMRTGWPQYIQAVDRCDGRAPIQAKGLQFYGEELYITPGDTAYRVPKADYTNYFCNEDEAKSAGYKHYSESQAPKKSYN